MDSSAIDQYYFLGTSLSDTGNFSRITNAINPLNNPLNPPFYSPDRFSDGKIWVDYFADTLKLQIEPFIPSPNSSPSSVIPDGINFAVGGALSGSGNIGLGPSGPGLKQEVDWLTGVVQTTDKTLANDLVFLETGSNDYLKYALDSYKTDPSKVKFSSTETKRVVDTNIADTLTGLVAQGAKNIAVFNLPDLGKTPLANNYNRQFANTLSAFSTDHNDRLNNLLGRFQEKYTGVNFVSIDINGQFKNILKRPSEFGIKNTSTPVTKTDLYNGILDYQLVDPNFANQAYTTAKTSLFWDSVHPTSVVHSLLNDTILKTLGFPSSLSARTASGTDLVGGSLAPSSLTLASPLPTV